MPRVATKSQEYIHTYRSGSVLGVYQTNGVDIQQCRATIRAEGGETTISLHDIPDLVEDLQAVYDKWKADKSIVGGGGSS